MILFLAFAVAVIVVSSGLEQITTAIRTQGPQAIEHLRQMAQTPYRNQEDCQSQTGTICNYQTCDFIPAGKTFEEVCGKDFAKGWHASNVEIPKTYATARRLIFSGRTPTAQDELHINRSMATITYRATQGAKHIQTAETNSIEGRQITLLINKMILYDFLNMQKNMPLPSATTSPVFAISLVSGVGTQTGTTTVSCMQNSCSRNFSDIQNDFLRLWGKPLTGIGISAAGH